MRPLREIIADARRAKHALGHFNISDSNQLKAIAEAAQEIGVPVVVGLSEGERDFLSLAEARALIDAYRAEGVPLYLNADHTYSFERAAEAIDAGVDSVVVDGAKLPLEENIALVRRVAAYAKESGKGVLVEAELGYIGASSKVVNALPEGAAVTEDMMPTPEQLKEFVSRTAADLVAPAVGNIHGMVKGGNPHLSIERIAALAEASPVPLILHGGSGVTDEDFTRAIAAGIVMVHLNTGLRVAYRKGLGKELEQDPEETTPYKFLAPAVEEMKAYISRYLKLFAGGA